MVNRVDFQFSSSPSYEGDHLLNGFMNETIEKPTKCIGAPKREGRVNITYLVHISNPV